jgi:hypothetical protein|tara:strand:+ start:10054 stop:10947 length:894 start_codon:yes stop_codon:yes gene_type:complete
MKLQDILDEGLSPILYHFTHVGRILNIIEQDKFVLRPYVGNKAEMEIGKNKKLFFLSTTRSKRGGYTTATENYGVFTLDGRKLAQKYKGSPIEYWGPDSRNADPERRSTEMEDRLYGDKPSIPNAHKYIKEINVMVGDEQNDQQNRRIRQLMLASKKRKIPIFFYANANDFLNHNKRKAIKIDIKTLKTPAIKSGGYSGRMNQAAKRNLGPVLELIKAPTSTKKLSKDAKLMVRDLVQDNYLGGMEKNIANNISNNAKDDLPIVSSLVKEFQKHGWKTTRDLIDWLQKKWTSYGDPT